MTHLLLWGNAYAQIIRNGRDEVIGLYPLMPDRMTVGRDVSGRLYSLLHARGLISDWKHEYNHERRHSGLGYRTPVEYARSCTHQLEETDSHTERT